MSKILLVAGHGYNDVGANANGYNERDFIRKYIVDNVKKYLKQAGHKVDIYGKKQDMFQDTDYGQRLGNYRDYGLYWVKSQGYNIVVEFHLDAAGASATGGHVIIAQGLVADKIDKGIAKAIEKHVGLRGGKGIDHRDNLLNVLVARDIGVNYRLVELGFITNKKDIEYIRKNADAYCKDIADAINGKEIKVASKKKPIKTAKKKVVIKQPSTYKVKKGDTLYKIATKHGITVAQLKSYNKLKTDIIIVGQTLKVKK